MPYRRTSCGRKSSVLVKVELARLYAQRTAVEDAIRELESRRHSIASKTVPPQPSELAFTTNIQIEPVTR